MKRLSHIDTWVFDLDNTLYPASCRLFDQIDWRMTAYVSDLLQMEQAEARKIQKGLFHKYGTTLRGLMLEHAVDAAHFLDHAHRIDYTPVSPDQSLDRALHALPGRKLIFTNGTVAHAHAVLARLGITHHFGDIFDIVHADFIPKPERAPYEAFIRQTGINPETSGMFEDIARNLLIPKALGMATILVTSPDNDDANHLNDQQQPDYIDFTTTDLAAFLNQIVTCTHNAGEQP